MRLRILFLCYIYATALSKSPGNGRLEIRFVHSALQTAGIKVNVSTET